MRTKLWHRIVTSISILWLLIASGQLPSAPLARVPMVQGATAWTAGSGNGSGATHWQTFTEVGAGSTSLHVKAYDGSLYVEGPGFNLPGVNGFDELITPVYDTIARGFATDLGQGWLLGAGRDVGLAISGGTVTFYDETGHPWPFTAGTGGSFTAPAGIDAALQQNGDGTYTLTYAGYRGRYHQYHFDSGGYLTSVNNRAGNSVTFTYDGSGRLTQITNTEGQATTVSYNAQNFISQISLPSGKTWSYGYDSNGNLTSITDPASNKTSFAYDANHYLTQITDPKGNLTLVSYTYSSRFGYNQATQIVRVTNTSNNTGPTWTISFGSTSSALSLNYSNTPVGSCLGSSASASPTTYATQETDPNGHTAAYDVGTDGLTYRYTDPEGNQEEALWSADKQPLLDVLPSGKVDAWIYNSNNDVSQATLPSGLCATWQYSDSNHPHLPTSVTDTEGNTTSFQYTTAGLLSVVTDPTLHTVSYQYNANGTVATLTDENNHVWSYGYTSAGLLNLVTPPLTSVLGTWSGTYNGDDVLAAETDGKGQTATYSYDQAGDLTQEAYSDSSWISYGYDANRNETSETDHTTPTSQITNWVYNALDQPTQKTFPAGNAVAYTWDGVDNLLSKTDKNASGTTTNAVTYAYTPDDDLASVTDYLNAKTTFSYDKDGNVTGWTYPSGVYEDLFYNPDALVTQMTSADTSGVDTYFNSTYSYTNPATNLPSQLIQSTTDLAGNTTKYTYDKLEQLTQAAQTNLSNVQLHSYAYVYDPAGNMTSKTVDGAATSMSYNADDQLTLAGNSSLTYDLNGNETSGSGSLGLAYNIRDQTVTATPNGGSAINMSYSGDGQTERTARGADSFQYDATGIDSWTPGPVLPPTSPRRRTAWC